MTGITQIPVSSPAGIAVFGHILSHGPVPRIDVARATGLSQAAVTKAVTVLIEDGFLEDEDAAAPPRAEAPLGRPANPLRVRAGRAQAIGVKVTADRVYAVRTDLIATPLAVTSRANPGTTPEAVLEQIAAVVAELSTAGTPISGVGITVSGDVDAQAGVVRDSPLMGWRDVPVAALLGERLGLPIVLENDVRALTIAEQMFGRGAGTHSFAMVTIGAGIGCGIFVNGAVVEGAHGVSGEIGHLPLAPGNLVCSCGRRGCVETIASSAAIVTAVRRALGNHTLDMPAVVELARAGDVAARTAFADAGETIGSALAALVNLIGPQRVIIAGEAVGEYDLYAERIRKAFAEHAFGSALNCEIIVASHTFEEWARGGAVAVIREIARGRG
ncbi:ROK family transcriptional regulator [Mycetocola lacteus]|uniref:ROK family transcriptional regulator n=1 Tax=Mycetocola lacteus TaxID=76637 RepID=A0A3L7ARQ3_9MICO|nr:ROK family protein [Mycetocola lacteus]RLP83183.1 ROK family transcriptional regulator [Mycetocola lacteus]